MYSDIQFSLRQKQTNTRGVMMLTAFDHKTHTVQL